MRHDFDQLKIEIARIFGSVHLSQRVESTRAILERRARKGKERKEKLKPLISSDILILIYRPVRPEKRADDTQII